MAIRAWLSVWLPCLRTAASASVVSCPRAGSAERSCRQNGAAVAVSCYRRVRGAWSPLPSLLSLRVVLWRLLLTLLLRPISVLRCGQADGRLTGVRAAAEDDRAHDDWRSTLRAHEDWAKRSRHLTTEAGTTTTAEQRIHITRKRAETHTMYEYSGSDDTLLQMCVGMSLNPTLKFV